MGDLHQPYVYAAASDWDLERIRGLPQLTTEQQVAISNERDRRRRGEPRVLAIRFDRDPFPR